MIQCFLFSGLVPFYYFSGLTLVLNDPNVLKALTLNNLPSGYDVEVGSKHFVIDYSIYYFVATGLLVYVPT